jgi:hypothetical protein
MSNIGLNSDIVISRSLICPFFEDLWDIALDIDATNENITKIVQISERKFVQNANTY